MVFSSATFLFYFLPATLALYFLTPPRFRNAAALVASLAFFAWGAPRFVFVLIATCFVDYHASRWLPAGRLPDKRRKLLLGAAIALDLGLLLYFKYANFFVAQFQHALGWFHHSGALERGTSGVSGLRALFAGGCTGTGSLPQQAAMRCSTRFT